MHVEEAAGSAATCPSFPLAIAKQQLGGGFSSNLAHVCSSLGKILNMVQQHFNQSEKSHDPKTCF